MEKGFIELKPGVEQPGSICPWISFLALFCPAKLQKERRYSFSASCRWDSNVLSKTSFYHGKTRGSVYKYRIGEGVGMTLSLNNTTYSGHPYNPNSIYLLRLILLRIGGYLSLDSQLLFASEDKVHWILTTMKNGIEKWNLHIVSTVNNLQQHSWSTKGIKFV